MEARAHMELMLEVGALSRTHIREGVHYFQNSGEPFDAVYGRIMDLVRDSRVNSIMRY